MFRSSYSPNNQALISPRPRALFFPFSRVFFLLILLSAFSFQITAQNFRNFPAITGKKDVAVNCVIQDKNGQLWMGTAAGLVKYDGETFHTYTKENGLVHDAITALLFQSDGTLWIGHKNGKVSLLKNGKFSPFAFNDTLKEEPISAFLEDEGIWIATYGAGLFRYSNNTLKQYNAEKGLSDDFVYSICNTDKGNIWIGTDAGITHVDVSSKEPNFAVMSMKEGLPDNIVRSLTRDNNGNLWIAMQDSGICKYDVKEKRFKQIEVSSNWKYGAITSLQVDRSGTLFIGTKKSGVVTYSTSGAKQWLRVSDSRNGLLGNEVNALLIDREENLWVTTPKGLSELAQGRVSMFTSRNGLLSDKILALLVDSLENYWIATDKGLVKYSLQKDGSINLKTFFLTEGMLEKQVTCIYQDRNGIIWLGTYGQGVFVVDPTTEKQERFTMQQGLANDNISSITSDKNGNYWIATLGGGISRIRFIGTGTGTSITNYSSKEGMPDDYVYSVFMDSKNNLWIGTDGSGLVLYDGHGFSDIGKKNSLNGKTVYSIREDKAGNIWFNASENGIYKYADGKFTNYTVKEGLRDNNIPIIAVTENSILAVHSKGIDMLDEKTNTFRYFSVSETDIEPNLNASYTDRDQNVWVGTNSGVVRFRSGDIPADTITPLVVINSLMVQYQPFTMDSTRDFSYRQNNFIFNFSAVWLRSDQKVRFRYKLEGSDDAWFETENKAASYSSLPPGVYNFQVSASNGEGKWSKPVEFKFTIATPLWQRWWFWVLVIGFASASIYFFIQYRLRALQKEKQLLETKVQERTAEIVEQTKVIEAKNKELERLSIVARETGNVIIIMDASGKLEWVNYSFEKVNGITLDDLKKLKGETIYEISNNPEIRNIISECIREKHSVVYESKNTLMDGRIMWESSTLTPIYDEEGKLRKLIIIDTDVTERKQTEEIIRQKNKDITDSIEYAKKIQTSILPGIDNIKQSLPKSFVFYLQKDIVSGDFFWFTRKDDLAIIAAVDCTGHGVPGAFMSLIGYNLLNQVVNENDITEPGLILDALNKGLIKALYQNNPNNTSKDGMDIAICCIDLKKSEVQFAGAMRPLYYFNGENFDELKGDKMSIGTKEGDRDHAIKFTNKKINAVKGDVFYIASDGYADQFGGGSGKKMMTKNFKEILKKVKDMPFEKQQSELMRYHREWKGEFEQVDDILVIGFSL